ncbi:putative Chymotrypsinogen B [Hypsibius exemplaris]|uniref:limulus clotting factor C n=1 Tax=Hypsibius exemplaris TaxID=2072580 RepID=A0A1W0WQX6_HYPEX|nr:putative Chymotrypsinogen B [Hypsibius exemplaris]
MLRHAILMALAFGIVAANMSGCGIPTVTPATSNLDILLDILQGKSPRIIGGTEAVPHSWPWQVVVLANGGLCGGSIINNRWVMTAGHCCTSWGFTHRPSTVKVVAGEHNRARSGEPNAKTYSISRVIPHNLYRESRSVIEQDFCLLQTTETIAFNAHVSNVCLGEARDDIVGRRCHVTGWGWTSYPGATASVLQQVAVNINDHADCDRRYRAIPDEDYKITEDMICASAPGKDSCKGDSGGPLVCQNADGGFNLVGVVSWGHDCAVPGVPGVYAKTSTALDWIANIINS